MTNRVVQHSLPKAVFLALLPVLLTVVVFHQQLFGLVEWWRSSSKYGHILVVFPYFIYMLYVHREELVAEPKSINLAITPLYLLTVFVILAAQISSIDVVGQTALMGLVPIALWMGVGFGIIRVIFFPLVLFLTAAPIWELITPFLTVLTTDVVNLLLGQLGLLVERNGAFLTIPEGTFEIAHGCGGYRYFIVGLTLGLMVAMQNFHSLKGRLLAISVAVFIALLGNWIRVMAVIWAGHVTNMQHPWIEEHVNLGWWIFLAVFTPFFIAARYFAEPEPAAVAATSRREVPDKPLGRVKSYLAIVLVTTIVAALGLRSVVAERQFALSTSVLSSVDVAGWQGPYSDYGSWSPNFPGAQFEKQWVYVRDGTIINVYIVGYVSQQPGAELVNVFSTFLNPGWRRFDSEVVALGGPASDASLNKLELGAPGGRRVLWSWYNVGGKSTASERWAKLLEIRKLISGDNYSFGVAIQYSQPQSLAEAQLLESFVAEYYSTFEENLKQAKEQR